MSQRLHEPIRTSWYRRRASFFLRGTLVVGPVATLLCLLVMTPVWPGEPTPAEVDEVRWALPSVVLVTAAAVALLPTARSWAVWLMATGVVLAVVRWFVDPLAGESGTLAGRVATLAAAFGIAVLLPWVQDSRPFRRLHTWLVRRGGSTFGTPVAVSPNEALGLLQAVLPDGFTAGLRDGRACAWWADGSSGRSVVVHTPGRGWVSTEVESGHADVQRGEGGPDELAVALRRALGVAVAYRSGGPVVDDRRTSTPLGGALLVLAEDGWHVLHRPQQVWAERITRRARDALRGRRG